MSLLVVGSVALDTIETPFKKVENAPGGSAIYISLSASYLTQEVKLVGVVGDDFPEDVLNLLREKNIDLEGLQVIKGGKTFRWHGRYHYDMNTRDTLSTQLNVFANFDPVIPDSYKESKYICLGNIDPELQLKVLKQVDKPRLVVADTMNFWIEKKYDKLLETLKHVDVLIINDAEARQLANEPNLIKSGKKIMDMGPSVVVIKKGEHGALLMTDDTIFSAPAYPLEFIQDPTGAGDTFAGGFTGWLARTDKLTEENLKKAVIYGSALASFCVEEFSINGIKNLTEEKLKERILAFKELTRFEI